MSSPYRSLPSSIYGTFLFNCRGQCRPPPPRAGRESMGVVKPAPL